MKKALLMVLLILMLISCCACSNQGIFSAVDATDVLQEDFAVALKKGDIETRNVVNEVIDEWLKNGKLDLYHDYYNALAKGENPLVPEGLTVSWNFENDANVLEMYTESTFAPYEFIYNNQIVGVDVAIASEVALKMGLKLVIKDVKFETVISGMNASSQKAIAVAGLTVDEERKKSCDFSHVYASSTLSIVQKKDLEFSSLESLNGLIIGVQQGTSGDLIVSEALSEKGYTYVYVDEKGVSKTKNIKINGQIVRYDSYTSAIEVLNLDKIDVIFMDKLPATLLVENSNANANADIFTKFYNAVIAENRWQLYFEGLFNTIIIAVLAVIIGVIVGFSLATAIYINKKTGKLKVVGAISKIYVTVIRGTPVVLQLFIMYFIVLSNMASDILIGAITFGLNSSAYVAEIARAGFASIDDGQTEAGRALGLPASKTIFSIIFPQALKNSLPPLFNEFISLIKETAVVGYVGIMDLGKVPGLIQSRTFDYLFPLLVSAGLYLIVVCLLTAVLKLLEKKFAKNERNAGGIKNV